MTITKTTRENLDKLLSVTSQEMILKLQAAGDSYTTITENTNLSRSQISLVATGKRTLGEKPYRELLRYCIARKIF